MTIDYLAPLERSWDRMVRALFRPFDLRKWFIVGFGAWLAYLGERGGGGFPGSWSGPRDIDPSEGGLEDFRAEAAEGLGRAIDWIKETLSDPRWLALVVFVVVFLFVLGVVLTWVKSRGTFVFLHQVVHDEAAVEGPWRRTRAMGNSLFWWHLGFGFAGLGVLVAAVFVAWTAVGAPLLSGGEFAWPLAIAAGVGLVGTCFAALLVTHYLDHFVVPIMFRDGLSVLPAWGRFLTLFGRHPHRFIGFTAFTVLLRIVLGVAFVVAFCATCCVSAIVLIVPYVGTVLLLPMYHLFRSWGPEFLAQFGPEWSVWHEQGEKGSGAFSAAERAPDPFSPA